MGSRPSGLTSTERGASHSVQPNQDGNNSPNAPFPRQPTAVLDMDVDSDNAFATAAGSAFLNDSKPQWGWDFILSFKLPKTLRAKLANLPSSTRTSENKKNCVEVPVEDYGDEGVDEDGESSGNDDNPANSFGEPNRGWCVPRWRGKGQSEVTQEGRVPHEEHGRNRYTRQTRKRVEILARLKSAGFVFSQLVVPSENVILVRISLPERQLKQKAVHIGLELRLKEQYGSGFLSYEVEREYAFMNDHHKSVWKCFFSPSERAVIILTVLQSKEHWGCDLNLERLVYDQTVLQAFALHSEPDRKRLVKRAVWARWWDPTWKPPLAELKDYLGARVTFYFVFVSFYARRLLLISIISIPVYTVYRVLQNYALIAILLWTYSLSLVLWTTFFLETWKRRNANVNIRWGVHDYREDAIEETRAAYIGDMRVGFYCEGGFVSLGDLQNGDGDTPASGRRHRICHRDDLAHNHGKEGHQSAVEDESRVSSPASSAVRTPEAAEKGFVDISPQTPQKNPPFRVIDLPRNPYRDPIFGRNAQIISAAVTFFFVLIVGGLTFLLLWFRTQITGFFLKKFGNEGIATFMPGLLNGVLITLFDPVWRWVSLVLTRRENHRTNQMFENSLIYKRFAFQFVSNYVSLFYIAFLRPYIGEQCTVGFMGTNDCMKELESQLMSLVVTRSTFGQVMELVFPFVTSKFGQWQSRRRSNADRIAPDLPSTQGESNSPSKNTPNPVASTGHNRYVQESKLAVYESTMDDYNELVIQFGYLTLFGLAFPPASAVCLLNNLIEVRTDAYKILRLSQRPNADDAGGIGAWYYILEFINILSVMTNVALLVFTADSINILFHLDLRFGDDFWRKLLHRVVAFFIAEHILLGLKGTAAACIPDVPNRTFRAIARQKFDIARWFNVGWQNAFRGISLLQVHEEQVTLCHDYAEMFDRASEDEGS